MTKATPKRLAAAILRSDLDVVTGYWEERHPEIGARLGGEVSEQIDKILKPFVERLERIAGDVSPYDKKISGTA